MDHYKNKQHTQCDGQHYPNPDKKGDMDSKDKESKIPRAKKRKESPWAGGSPSSPSQTPSQLGRKQLLETKTMTRMT